MANLKKKLSLLTGLCVIALFCLVTATAVSAAAAPATYPCLVSVEGSGTVNGSTKLETEAFSEVVLYAPAEKDGQSFLYWKNAETGLVVSDHRRTAVRVYDNTVFEAVYGDATEASADAFVLVTDGELSLYVYRYVPESHKVVSYGVLYSTVKNPVDLTDKTLEDVDAPNVKVAERSTSSSRVGSVYYTVTAPAFSYRPFVTVEDASGNVKTVYGDAMQYVPCEEHTYTAYKDTATCSMGGVANLRCDVCAYHTSAASKPTEKHSFTVEVPEKKPTCTVDGYSAHKLCSACGAANEEKVTAEEDESYKAKGHEFKDIPATEPTCYSYGYSAHKECSVCHGKSEEYEEIAMLPHALGEEYFVPASNRDGAYLAKNCTAPDCSYFEKKYTEGEKGVYVVDVNGEATKKSTFDVTVSDAGVYELSFKLASAPAVSGYTSVYAANGKGSVNRIGEETDEDGYSLYTFYLYLEKGKNTVTVNGQAQMTIAKARLTFLDAVGEMTSFEGIETLEASSTYLDGMLVTSSATQARSVRNGVLQLRRGDKVTFSLTAERGSAYRLVLVSNGGLALTVADQNGETVASFAKTDFAKCNADALTAGSESAVLYRLAKELTLPAGEYRFTVSSPEDNLILGGIMLTPELHTHEFTNDVEGKAPTCGEGGYEAYKVCALCGRPETAPKKAPHDFSVTVLEKLPSCFEDGYSAHKECSVCGEKDEQYEEYPSLDHTFGDTVHVDATYKWGAYTAKRCSVCGFVDKSFTEGSEQLSFVGNGIAHSGKTVTFNLTVPASGVYELSFTFAAAPAVEGYTSVYAQNGLGSTNRIGKEVNAKGVSPYKFYVYLEKGENTVTMKAQAALTVSCVTATYVAGNASGFVQSFSGIGALGTLVPNKEYPISNGKLITGEETKDRGERLGTLRLCNGDKVIFSFTASADGAYLLGLLASNNNFKMTLTKGSETIVLSASDFAAANAAAMVKGTEGTRLVLLKNALLLTEGEYTVAVEMTGDFALGTVYITLETHVCSFSEEIPAIDATCGSAGHEAYKACPICGEPEGAVEEKPVDENAHVWRDIAEKLPTCLEDGYTAHKVCTLCGEKNNDYELKPQTDIHAWTDVPRREASCDAEGYTAHKMCAVCSKTDDKKTVLEKIPHTYFEVEEKPATCTEKGYTAYKECSVCHGKNEEYKVLPIDPKAHSYATVEEKAPSCTVEGYNEHNLCEICGYSPDRFIVPATGHEYGARYEVAATYKSGAYTAVKCGLCGDVKKEYSEGSEQLLFVGNGIDHNGTTVTFNLTVPAAGVYELSFKFASAPAASGSTYTSVYAANGKGSVNRIGAETDENGDSAYKFYVYLKKGENTVTMKAQAALIVSCVTATYIAAEASSYVEKLSGITRLKPSNEYAIPNGKLVTSSNDGARSVRNGVLVLLTGDTLSFTYTAAVDGKYTIAFISSNDQYTMTLTKGDEVLNLTKSDFEAANASAKNTGSESALFYTSKQAYMLSAGEYTVTFTSAGRFVLGATYITCETHICSFSEEIPAMSANCLSAGHEAYTACSICGEPEGAVVGIPKEETAHDFSVTVPEISATCQAPGVSAYKTCSVCGVENGEKTELPIDPDAHQWNGIPEKLPTCTEDGYSAYKDCALCDAIKDKVTEGYESKGHQWNDIPEKEASCGEAGHSAHKECSVCGEKDEQYEEYPSLDHAFGDTVHIDATYTHGGYDMRECSVCGEIEKTYAEDEPMFFYTVAIDKTAQNFTFDVTVSDAGLYEIAFKITSYPSTSGVYTSVYAANGKGSVVRIGAETDADGYSLYRFYVYLEEGKNTVSVKGQAAWAVEAARVTFVSSVSPAMTESFESISKLEASKTYTVTNGSIVTSSNGDARNVRYGVLQFRENDTVSYTLTVPAEAAYRIAFISSNNQYTMTLTKGDEVLSLTKSDFEAANASAKTAGSESAMLFLSKNEYTLSAGTYTVTFKLAGNFILGAVYFLAGTHTCDYVTVESVLPTLTAPGYTSYEACSVCGAAKTEKQELAPLYNKTDVVTVGSDAITVDGKTATVKVTVENDGFYYLTSDMTLSAKAYYSAKSDAFSYLSKNRIPAGESAADYGVTVYLKAGENTVTVSADASISSMTEATFTRVSEKMAASLLDSYTQASNGNEAVRDHEEKKLTVKEDGTYCLGGLVKLSGTGLSMKIEIYDEAGTTLLQTVTVDTATLTALISSDGRKEDGSTETSTYLALDTITLSAGTYSVKTTMSASTGIVNYYGIVLTELAYLD